MVVDDDHVWFRFGGDESPSLTTPCTCTVPRLQAAPVPRSKAGQQVQQIGNLDIKVETGTCSQLQYV